MKYWVHEGITAFNHTRIKVMCNDFFYLWKDYEFYSDLKSKYYILENSLL